MPRLIPSILTIAGSDCSGGAGIQADIKSISANGGYASSVITALTAQNTVGVYKIQPLSRSFISAQLEAIFSDIPVNAVKIGMLYTRSTICSVKAALLRYRAKNIVLDPVMLSKSRVQLINSNTLDHLIQHLFPIATLLTPNIPEAEVLTQSPIQSKKEMEKAAQSLGLTFETNVLIKGGHLSKHSSDDILYLYSKNELYWLSSRRVKTKNTHGTGCSLSSSIATYLAKQYSIISAVETAKQYVYNAIYSGQFIVLGKGHNPIDHFYFL